MLPNGRILCTLRCQRDPTGVMWTEIYHSDDGGSWDVGYPNAWVVGPGKVGVLYYFNSKDDSVKANGGVRHIARSIFSID